MPALININSLLLLLLLAACVAMLGSAFQAFMKPGQIFNWWALFLLKMVDLSSQKRTITAEGCDHELTYDVNQYWYIRLIAFFSKPLGLCPYCNSTWIAIITFVLCFNLRLEILLFIGMTWFFVMIIKKIESIKK